MTESKTKVKPNPEGPGKPYPPSGLLALACSGGAALILAFLVPFSLLQSCSPANIATFMVLLGLSAVLAFVGTTSGAISYRKSKNRPALFSLLFTAVYIALLIYFWQLIYR
jgi:hypothetical protein